MKYAILSIVLLLLSFRCIGQNVKSIDFFLKTEMEERHIPGLTIAIIQNGKVLHKKAYGYSVIEHCVPSKIETVYELASITKQFIATGILLLEQDNLLDIDVPIENYLDSLPEKWKSLTIKQLLSHTAGLAPMENEWKSLKQNRWPKYVTRKMLWNSAIKDSIFATPGTQFRYHNVGYSLSVFIIEKITQDDHRKFFKERIFEPLEMNNTFFEDQSKVTPNKAEGYTLKNGKLAKIWRVGQEEIGVGDGLYSSLEDMIKWNNAIRENRLLTSNVQAKMFRRIKLNNDLALKYGLGWWISERNGITYYYHNGITGSEFLKIPSIDLDIIILSNLGQGEFDDVHYWGLAHKIAGDFFDKRLKHPPLSVLFDSTDHQYFTGTFEYESEGKLKVYLKGDKFFLKDSFGESLMIYKGNNTFTLEDDPVIFKYLSKNRIQVIEELWNDDFANRKE